MKNEISDFKKLSKKQQQHQQNTFFVSGLARIVPLVSSQHASLKREHNSFYLARWG